LSKIRLPPKTALDANSDTHGKDLTQLESRLVSFQSSDGAIKGSFRVEGCQVIDADLLVKFPKWNKGAAFKTAVSAYAIHQVLNASVAVKAALRQLRLLPAAATAALDPAVAASPTPAVRALVHSVRDILSALRVAMRLLLAPGEKQFPFPDQTLNFAFQPPLPIDVLVEFTVEKQEIVVVAYQLAVLTQAPTKAPVRQHLWAGSPIGIVFQVVLHGVPHLVEVVDFAQVACPCQYTGAVAGIYTAIQLCSELLEKARLF